MKKVEAIIRPEKLPVVRGALEAIGITGLTITQVVGHGAQMGVTQEWRGTTYTVDLIQKIKLEMVVPDAKVEAVIEAIAESAVTGAVGDGKMFVSPVDDAIRVRTRERGDKVL
jgi:nitrogen regulatory protein P-II 1